MSEHHSDPGPDPSGAAPKSKHEIDRAQVKAAESRKDKDVQHDVERAQAEQRREHAVEEAEKKAEQADEAGESASADKAPATKQADGPAKKQPAKQPAKKEPAKKQAAKKEPTKKQPAKKQSADDEDKLEVVDRPIGPKQKPELDETTSEALEARAAKKAKTPVFRRHEWWRYKDLGGKHASWRRPRGIHSKQRRHFKYRPPVVSIGYRGPRAARGLHPSGFEEVLVYRPEDLVDVDPKTQAARVGGTVGGRKAEMIEKEADKLGIRVLNRRQS